MATKNLESLVDVSAYQGFDELTSTERGTMKLIELKCPNCGAYVDCDPNAKSCACEYCDSSFVVDAADEVGLLEEDKANGYCKEFPIADSCSQEGYQSQAQSVVRAPSVASGPSEDKPKRKTWLWVIGWIFMFPIPLTILMIRNKSINKAIRYGVIVLAWVSFLRLGACSNSGDQETEANNSSSSISEAADQASDDASLTI